MVIHKYVFQNKTQEKTQGKRVNDKNLENPKLNTQASTLVGRGVILHRKQAENQS